MKRKIAVLVFCAVLCAAVCVLPDIAVNAAPVASLTSPKCVNYCKSLTACGTLSYLSQSDVVSTLPLVIKSCTVKEGDYVEAGDTVAVVDKEGSASFIESMGQLSYLSLASSGISAAVGLIPDTIAADRSGKVLSTAGNGAAVEAGGSICTIAGTDTLVMTAPVSELYISSIEVGQPVSFTLSAYPDAVMTGTVSGISGSARNRYSGAVLETVVDVTITPDFSDPRMKSGLTADVTFQLEETRTICVLPYNAIGQDEAGEYIYLYKDGKAVRQNIFTGAEFSDGTEVIRGVSESDLVFTSPEELSGKTYIRMVQSEE